MRVRVLGAEVSPWPVVLGVTAVSALFSWALTAATWRLNSDSFDYLILARNFLATGEFAQLGQLETNRPLGYPALVALFGLVFDDLERAGHVVAALCGVLTIPVMFWLARQVTSIGQALLAAVLLGLNGYLIHANSRLMTETASMLFLALAAGFLLRAIRASHVSLPAAALFGAFASLAYLCRNELLLFFPMGLLSLLVHPGERVSRRLAALGVALSTMALLSAPHWVAQSRAAGHFSVGGNSVNLIWFQSDAEERPPASLDPAWAPRPLDPKFPHRTHPSDFSASRYIRVNTPELVKRFLLNGLSYLWPACEILFFGLGVPLFFLGVRELVGRIGLHRTLPLLLAFLPVVAGGFRAGTARLLVPYLPFTTLFAAVGFAHALAWARERYRLDERRTRTVALVAVALLLVGPLSKFARHLGREDYRDYDAHRAAGQLMRERARSDALVVMAREPGFGYFAGAEELRVPATEDPEVVVVQMDRWNAQFLVLRGPGRVREGHLAAPIEHPRLALLRSYPDEIFVYELAPATTPTPERAPGGS